ncbi:TPA: hypothetical protein ACF26J_005162, partial [Klebsiella quasipneumoniae subsp. similipneumoniae]
YHLENTIVSDLYWFNHRAVAIRLMPSLIYYFWVLPKSSARTGDVSLSPGIHRNDASPFPVLCA